MRIAPFFVAAPYHRALMDKASDRQAPWRTCVQVVSCLGMAAGGLYLFLGDTMFELFRPNAADSARDACMAAAVLSVVCGGAAYWGSLRRLRPDPRDRA